MTTIGILGGGAAARLLAQAAQRIGVNVAVLDPDQFSPAMQVTGLGVSGSWDDDDVLAAFADAVDAVTIGGITCRRRELLMSRSVAASSAQAQTHWLAFRTRLG